MPPKSSTASIQPVNFFCFVRGRGSESGNPRGHFGPRLNVTAKPTKLKPKLFLNSFWFSSKSCSTGIFINGVRSFFDTENKKCCSFQEFFTVTNIISIRWNRCSFPCVYLWRWMPGWQEIVASWKKLNWGMPSLYIGRKWLTLKYLWCWADQRRSLRRHIFMSGLSSNGSIAWNIWEVVEIRWGSNEGPMMQFPSRVGLETLGREKNCATFF